MGLFVISLLSGCANLPQAGLVTPLPTGHWPTAIALTLEASGVDLTTPTPTSPETPSATSADTPIPTATTTATATSTSAPTLTATPHLTDTVTTLPITTSVSSATETPFQITLPAPPEETPPPEIPEARVQIYRLGELSIVTSPFHVSTRITSRDGAVVRIDLRGEDGRTLARELRTFQNVPWQAARIGRDMEFEFSGAAELGRLIISVEDVYGRLIDANSVNLILLSTGTPEINPYSALWQRIIIQEPVPKALIQGGTLVVSGRVRPNNPEHALKTMLIDENGQVLGHRLASISIPIPGDYGTFAAEVPYKVSDITPALLVVFEDGGQISEIAHLASLEVILTP